MANQLPNELIVEILSRLPSKSLIRFQSVCKSWRSLITSTEFRLMHFHNFNKPNPRYLVRRFELRENREVYIVYLDDQHFTLDADAQIKFPFRITSPRMYCYGIIGYWKDLHLVLGFGYDTVSDDYKVVRVAYDGLFFSSRPHVEIYTVKTAVWRVVTFPDDLRCFFICPNQSQVFFNGSVHWIASSDPMPDVSRYSIMTFDMSTEGFGEIELPKDLPLLPTTKVVVTVVGEFLGVIYTCGFNPSWSRSSNHVIWAMKEYKNPTSWTIMHNLDYPDKNVGRVLHVRNNEDLITESGCGDLTIYNHETCHYVYTSSMRIMLEDTLFVDRYQESLALLDAERDAVLYEARVEEGRDEGFDDESLARYEARYLIQLFGE
ncbi:hypothetical protein OSB04_un001586 [Centaurea solstitialis]|uniref:F-box domain-containing protein n=1 Tax=Centaurea solstitialis TaxID=347529 RepID=A0AA38VUJ3_9ASTR|nr:hypothetical protein OSB04_un001586 [Centaurea solstitialis]